MKEFVPNERMAWEVRRSNLKAYHAWVIIPNSNGCRLITTKTQKGLLTFLPIVFQPYNLLKLHDKWLRLIKERAEGNYKTITENERLKMQIILESSLMKFNNAVSNLSNEQLNFRLLPTKWTIAECIEHIALAELEFPKILEREIQKPSNHDLRKKINIKDQEIQPKMTSRKWKAKSPEIFKPSNKFANAKEAIETFQNQRNETIAYVGRAKDDLRNHYWKHPLTGKIDLYQTLLLMSAHLERHIEQIENIKSLNSFPKSQK